MCSNHQFLDKCEKNNILVSIGHSAASYEDVLSVMRHTAACHITHLFNAMPAMHHRAPGIIGAAFTEDKIRCELICDNLHEDHFNAAYVNTYLMHNTVQNVYIPKITEPPNQYEDVGVVVPGRSGARIFSIGERDEEIYYDRISDDSWIIFFKTIHMGGSQYNARHYGIIIISSGYSYLFMADTDWTYAVKNVVQLLKDTTLKAAFVNPLSYMDARGKEWLSYLHECLSCLLSLLFVPKF